MKKSIKTFWIAGIWLYFIVFATIIKAGRRACGHEDKGTGSPIPNNLFQPEEGRYAHQVLMFPPGVEKHL